MALFNLGARVLSARGSAKLLGPLALLVALVLVVVFVRDMFADIRADIRKNTEIEISNRLAEAADARLHELTLQVKQLSEDSQRRADALDVQQRKFAANTTTLIAQLRNTNTQTPIVTVTSEGECRITTEAAHVWNQLQNSLQQ